MNLRVADYIFRYLADYGVRHVFLVVGGGAMHLNDALKNESRIRYICHHHEQGAAVAAEGYARTAGKLAVVSVTSGPGGTNALTGTLGQWLDSVPVLYLSGQVKFETTIASVPDCGLRQLGDQEINIVDIVRPLTKYASMVTDPLSIKVELDRAIHYATSGRPGPVWLDIPLNVQGALIDTDCLHDEPLPPEVVPAPDQTQVADVVALLKQAKRPVVIAGHGIRLAGAQREFRQLIRQIGIPVLSTFNGFDLIESDDRHFVGRIGTLGSRAGNFALQNADVVLFLGTRNNIRQISYNWTCFARKAKKILVDIDAAELHKKTMPCDVLIHADAGRFLTALLKQMPADYHVAPSWLEWCLVRREKYPVVLEEYKSPDKKAINPYYFIQQLTSRLAPGAVLVADNGSACVVLFQAGVVKSDQRIFWNSGCASMGYSLPASIGAALAAGKETICLTGDGSMQMNLQELQTIRHYQLPVKVLVLCNNGYISIKQTQTNFFPGSFIGCDGDSGVSFPDNEKLAALYDLPFFRIDSAAGQNSQIDALLAAPGPALCEVALESDYIFAPKLSSEKKPDGTMVSKPLEDMYPFLDREEFRANMIAESDSDA